MSLNDMIQSISRTGIQIPNRYSVTFDFPISVREAFREQQIDISQGDMLSVRVERVTIPAQNISLQELPSQSRTSLNIARGRETLENLNFSVILSQGALERKYFEVWQEVIYGKNNDFLTMYYDRYVASSVLVKMLNANDEVIERFSFINAFPVSVGDIEMSYSENDAYLSCAISMAYESWTRS